MTNKNKYEIHKTLFIVIIISLIPYVLYNYFGYFKDSSKYNLSVIGIFIIQIIYLITTIFKNKIKIKRSKVGVFSLIIFLLLLILFVQILQAKISYDYMDILYTFSRIATIFIYLILLSNAITSESKIIKLYKNIVYLGLVLSMINIIMNFNQIPNALLSNNPYQYNFQSIFRNRNTFAQFLMISIMILDYLKTKYKSILYILIKIFLGFNLLITFSRTSIFSYLIFFSLFTFLKSNNKIKLVRITFITLIPVTFLFLKMEPLKQFVLSMIVRSNVGTSGRVTLWKESVYLLINTNIITGIGEFTATNYMFSQGLSQTQMHNMYIDILLTGGIVLLLLFFSLVVFLLNKYKEVKKHNFNYGKFLISSFISFIIYAVFESVSFFSVGYVPTIFTIFHITIPLIYLNSLTIPNNA